MRLVFVRDRKNNADVSRERIVPRSQISCRVIVVARKALIHAGRPVECERACVCVRIRVAITSEQVKLAADRRTSKIFRPALDKLLQTDSTRRGFEVFLKQNARSKSGFV